MMRRRYVLLLLCLPLLCVSTPGATLAADDELTVRVGVYENPPKIFTDEEGKASGFWPDIIQHIARKEGWKIEYVPGSWAECLQRLESNEIDIMPDVAYTAERGQTYQFGNEVVYTSWAAVYAREGSGIQSVLDLEGKTIAVLQGSVNVEGPGGIKELVGAFNVDCTFIEAASYAGVFELVRSGDADAGVTSKDHGYRYKADFNLEETPIIFQPSLLYFAFPKDSSLTPSLIVRIDADVRSIKENSDSVYYQALDQWFAQKATPAPIIPRWLIVALAVVAGLACLLGAGSLVLRAQVTSRTRDLTLEIARRNEAEQELGRSHEHLEELVRQRTRELEQANRHKSQFLANMSHELHHRLHQADAGRAGRRYHQRTA
jgi:ABC-type amino acid transport substrate-binding protein